MAIQTSSRSAWAMTEGVGGRFLNNLDPIFTTNEDHILLATRHSIHVYELSTSILVRKIGILDRLICSIALSPSDDNLVYVIDVEAKITLWNLTSGEQEPGFEYEESTDDVERIIKAIYVAIEEENESERITIAVEERSIPGDTNTRIISLVREHGSGRSQQIKTIHTISGTVFWVKLLDGALFVLSEKAVDIGAPAKDGSLRWIHFNLNQLITCADIHVRQSGKGQKEFDLVIGDSGGKIAIYDNITDTFRDPKPQMYHWHREAVTSVKFELDGKRVISGGSEPVLIFFTRSTGRKDTLPHLSSSIARMQVSKSGKLYAVQLGDNSVLVLTATELKVAAAFAGPQSHSARGKIPAVVNPRAPDQLLLAVPATTYSASTGVGVAPSAPYLQTFNITIGAHVTRQALSRANVTNINTAPNNNGRPGQRLKDTNVVLIQISHDGEWLCTVDEWSPPEVDLAYLATSRESLERERRIRREVALKFWRWNPKLEGGSWVLETKIEQPHIFNGLPLANRVLDIAASRNKLIFATIGEDAAVRIWKPKTFKKDGQIVRNAIEGGVMTWLVDEEILLKSNLNDAAAEFDEEAVPCGGKLAWSDDDSILAAALDHDVDTSANTGRIHLINTAMGTVSRMIGPMFTPSILSGLAFLGRYLVSLSDNARVHDVVDDRGVYTSAIDIFRNLRNRDARSRYKSPEKQLIRETAILASSRKTSTFAVAVPVLVEMSLRAFRDLEQDQPGIYDGFTVKVFRPTSQNPIYSFDLPSLVTGLVALPHKFGYAALDQDAEIRLIGPDNAGALGAISSMTSTGMTNGGTTKLLAINTTDDDAMELDTVDAPVAKSAASDEDEDSSDDERDQQKHVTSEQLAGKIDEVRKTGGTYNDLVNELFLLYVGKKDSDKAKDKHKGKAISRKRKVSEEI